MGMAAGDHGRTGKGQGNQYRQCVTNRRDAAAERIRHHDRHPGNHRCNRQPGRAGYMFTKQQRRHQRRNQRHPGLHQQNVGHAGVGQGADEGGRRNGETRTHRQTGPAHGQEQRAGAAQPVAPEHESQQKQCRKGRAPEHHGPAFLHRQKPRNRPAKTPGRGRAQYQQRRPAV